MQQMQMDGLHVVKVDYENLSLPATAKMFKPPVYKDGTDYCCLLGPHPQAGIFGCGETPEEAMADWAEHLEERLSEQDPNDEIAAYVRHTLNKKP